MNDQSDRSSWFEIKGWKSSKKRLSVVPEVYGWVGVASILMFGFLWLEFQNPLRESLPDMNIIEGIGLTILIGILVAVLSWGISAVICRFIVRDNKEESAEPSVDEE